MKMNVSTKQNMLLVSMAGLLLTVSSATAVSAENGEIVKDTKPIKKVIAVVPSDIGFDELDGDRNGKISLKEARRDSALIEKFNHTDVNQDGTITVDEYAMFALKANKTATKVN